jgi:DNA-binding transcriptional ArsR family regulator
MEQLDCLEIDDIEIFEVLNNPMRFRILRELMSPGTVRDLAEVMQVPPTRLYYHVNLLEDAGIIAVAETRKAGAMVQKVYQTTAKGFKPSPRLAQGDHEPSELAKIAAGVVFDGARIDAEEALTTHFERVRSEGEHKLNGALSRTVARFSSAEAEEFVEKLSEFIEEHFDPHDREDGDEYGLTLAFLPVSGTNPWEETA